MAAGSAGRGRCRDGRGRAGIVSRDVVIPAEAVGESQSPVVATWFYRTGEAVKQGDVIAEVLAEKVAYEIEAPVSGTLEVLVDEEVEVTAGQTIARIG